MKDRDVRKLQREVKTLRRELKQTRKVLTPDKPGLMGRLLGKKGEGGPSAPAVKDAAPTAFSPADIPRDHLLDPSSVKKEAVMAGAGLEAAEQAVDKDFDLEWLAKTTAGTSMRSPRFLADAFYGVADKAGVAYWAKKQRTIEQASPHIKENPHAFQPAPVLAVEAAQEENHQALLGYLKEGGGRLGAVGCGPHKATAVDLAVVDRTLTNLLNETEQLVALGPVGLDAGFGGHTVSEQQALLALQLEIALDFNVPVLIWQKGAGAELLENVKPFMEKKGVLIYVGAFLGEDMNPLKEAGGYLAVRAELANQDAEYCTYVEKWPEDRLLIASGDMAAPAQAHTGDWNGPQYLEETLQVLFEVRTVRNKTAFMHQLNRNFAKAFYGLEGEKTS